MKKYMSLFLCVVVPLSFTAMDKKLTQQELLEKIAELRKKIDSPSLYENCGGVLLHKFGSPISYLDFITSKIKQNPNLELKDIQCAGKPMVESLVESKMCSEVLAFMLDHGCQKPVNVRSDV